MPQLIHDGRGAVKSFSLESLTAESYREIFHNDAYPGGKGAHALYSVVPTLYACVDKRAKAVESMPFYFERDGERLEDDEDAKILERGLRKWLYLFEASLCLFGATYAVREKNRIGYESMRWVSSVNVMPRFDQWQGLIGFNRLGQNLTPEELIYIWRNSLTQDVGPGVAPVDVALAGAAVVLGINQMVAETYKNGLIKAFILSVEPNPMPNESDLKRLEQRFTERIFGGIRSMFKPIAVRANVKPEIISSDLKESYPQEMIISANDEIAQALGVPQSLIKSEALAGGTVDAERLSFYDFTILPECTLIANILNEQYYTKFRLELEWAPDELEVYQNSQLAQAVTVATLTGGKAILTVDEARELIGLEPSPELNKQQQEAAQQAVEIAQASKQPKDGDEQDQQASRLATEREQVKRYAHNRLRDGKPFEFKSNVIAQNEIDAVKACATHGEIDDLDLSANIVIMKKNDQQIDELISAIKSAEAELARPQSQPITIYNNIPPTNVSVQSPDVNVSMPEMKFTSEPAVVNVTVEPAPVMVQNAGDVNVTVEPAPVTVESNRTLVMQVERNPKGQITGAIAEAQ